MKILILFVDMLRPNLLNVCNESVKESELSNHIKKWGGTLYTNCYTPSPDTPRSQAAFFSSLYPIKNGCDTRTKYPKYFLKKPYDNIFDTFLNGKYKIHIFMNKHDLELGELPRNFSNEIDIDTNYNLDEYLKEIKIEKDSINYIAVDDYHFAVDDCRWFSYAKKYGDRLINDVLNKIDKYVGVDSFDLVVFYSDHGWKMTGEKNEDIIDRLSKDRTNIFLLIRKKGERDIHIDNQICNVMDIAPTICSLSNVKMNYSIDGINLMNNSDENRFIVISDHKDFSVKINSTIEYWGFVNKNGMVCNDCFDNWRSTYNVDEKSIKLIDKYFSQLGDFYQQNRKEGEIKKLYNKMVMDSQFFSNGKKRKKISLCRLIFGDINNLIKIILNR